MKKITNKEYAEFEQYKLDKLYGRIITPAGLKIICNSLNNDAEQIGKHMLNMVAKFKSDGII